MTQEDVLVSRTTSPYEEDHYQVMWWCDNCEEAQPIEPNYEEEA
jgi:hypothetical protein